MSKFGFGVLGLVVATSVACSAAPPAEESSEQGAAVSTESTLKCDPAAEKERLKATFERTTDCAADAVSAGFAEKVKLAGETVAQTKKLVTALRAIAPNVLVKDLSTARAILCVRSATEYVSERTAHAAIVGAVDGLTDAEASRLADEAIGSFTFGASDVFKAASELAEKPSAESLVAFIAAFLGGAGDLGSFVASCGPVLAPYGVTSIPAFAGYAEKLGDIGTIGSILNCSYAAVGNAIDVADELRCLAQDIQVLKAQFETLKGMNTARCQDLAAAVDNPVVLPLLRASGNASEERAAACYGVLHRWGSCLDVERSKKTLSCDECARACTAYVNAAGPNAYLEPTLRETAAISGGDTDAVKQLVFTAATYCGTNVIADGLKPCIDMCRGQVADCK